SSLGDARDAAVEQIERGLDGLAHNALGRRPDAVAPLEGVVDGFGKLGMRHMAKTLVKTLKPRDALSRIGRGESSVSRPSYWCQFRVVDGERCVPLNGCGRPVLEIRRDRRSRDRREARRALRVPSLRETPRGYVRAPPVRWSCQGHAAPRGCARGPRTSRPFRRRYRGA